jgi:hypothetical protein
MVRGARGSVAAVCVAGLIGGSAASALAQNKELSDKSVLTLMRYAWGMVPEKFTTPQGKTIVVDKAKTSESMLPLEAAREVILVGRLSAQAQRCELEEELRANFQTLMRREQAKGTWSDQQMLFINQLHLFMVMWLSGRVQLTEKDGDKQVGYENKPAKTETCTDTERKKISAQIMAYVNSAPSPAPPADAAAAAAKRPEPMPASQKK